MPGTWRGGKSEILQSSSCPQQAEIQEVETAEPTLLDGIMEQLDLSKKAPTELYLADEEVISKALSLNVDQGISRPTCPQQSIVGRAEFQDNSDEESVSFLENSRQSDIVSETEEDLSDWNPNEIADMPKQAADFQATGSMETELVAKRLTRSDSLETFTGGDDSPRNTSSKFFRRNSRPLPWYQRNFNRNDDSSENDWVCIVTKKHPETKKPFHHGKIRSFRNLFENSFQMSFLYDPNARDRSQNFKPIKFDGNNVEIYREFEQSMLITIINNNSLDFDKKFLALLDTLNGSPLALVQSYTDELDAFNFVRAIEDLYYTYGEPTKFINALVRQLINEDPIDIRNPESFLKIKALVTRICRTFDASNDILSMSFILEAIDMTPETAIAFKTWLYSTREKKSLKVLLQWLDWMYQDSISENLLQKSAQGFKNVKHPPVLTKTVHPKYEEVLKARCQLCFGKIHDLEGCHVYMFMTPNQRKIALTIYGGCFLCTKKVHAIHIGSNGNFCERRNCWMPCQMCQSSEHHFSICEASDEPFKAVLKQY